MRYMNYIWLKMPKMEISVKVRKIQDILFLFVMSISESRGKFAPLPVLKVYIENPLIIYEKKIKSNFQVL